jgi:UDP-2,3-diacylglucosamine pyrophosphatase LpxH
MGGIIVIADTHFGLRKGSLNMSMPGYFSDFLEWIESLENHQFSVSIVDGSIRRENIKKKTITYPDKIIFLGDIFELWDSEKEPVTICRSTIIPTLSQIKAEKIYVLGNHDNILDRTVLEDPEGAFMYYRLGRSNLKVYPDVYPPPSTTINSEKYGNEEYVFVHGHQFDRLFKNTGATYKLWSVIRNASNSLTMYVPALFAVSIVVWVINKVFHTSIFLGENPTLGLLFLLTIPRIYMDFGRRLWDLTVGARYKKLETVIHFVRWWKRFMNKKTPPHNLNVVYGHTHFLNYIPSPKHEKIIDKEMLYGHLHQKYREKSDRENIPEEHRPALINISAWVTDFLILSERLFLSMEKAGDQLKRPFTEREKNRINPDSVAVGTFLYIDEEGFEFFGWNWYSHEPAQRIFHIPKAAIIKRREVGPVTDDDAVKEVLEEIGWPDRMIILWEKDPHS